MVAEVHIVHAVDTEGPLYESLDAKFDRLMHLFGITDIARTWDNFRKLQAGELDLGGKEADVKKVLSGHLTNYMETWSEVDAMLDRVTSSEFRTSKTDSYGNGWLFNWFCLDHINYKNNPRRRDIGNHNVFDHYRARLEREPENPDAIHWHFHPMSTYNDANKCATHYFRSPEIFEILCRKIIERQWFPSNYRAGFQAERPDSHWFLEQWIPFDISNMAQDDNSDLETTVDFRNGRSGNWRKAPSDWSVYNPSHDDYQVPGQCRRHIGRALNVLNRIAAIDQREMDKAFARAQSGLPALVGICSHDFRDLGTEVDYLRELIDQSHSRYPDVKYRFSESGDAFRNVIWPDQNKEPALELDLSYTPATTDDVPSLKISTLQGSVFGPQPYLAIETRSHRFIHDNLDFNDAGDEWYYAFHDDTLPIEDVARIGVAANDRYGNTCVRNLDLTNL